MLFGRVVRAIDDPQVLLAAALYCRLNQPLHASNEKIDRLDDHPFPTASRPGLPPAFEQIMAQ